MNEVLTDLDLDVYNAVNKLKNDDGVAILYMSISEENKVSTVVMGDLEPLIRACANSIINDPTLESIFITSLIYAKHRSLEEANLDVMFDRVLEAVGNKI